jgi:hypothetical protein
MLLFVFFALGWRIRERALRSFVLLSLFGTQAAFLLTSLGGAPLSPTVCLLPVMLWVALQEEGLKGLLTPMSGMQAGAWLALVVLWGCGTALAVPRLWEGMVTVFTTDRSADQLSVMRGYLKPVSTNYTQSLYAVGALLAFCAVSVLVRRPGGVVQFRKAVLTLATWNIVMAALNLLELYGHVWTPLTIIRAISGYGVFAASSVGGLARITGVFPEASAFAGFTLGMFAYCFSLWRSGIDRDRAGWLALISFVLLVLSTSTTAYAGIVGYLGLLGLGMLGQSFFSWRSSKISPLVGLTWLVLVAACITALAMPEWLQAAWDYFELTVLRKLQSDSGIERSSWNAGAWQNFLDSYGIGLGLGSTRASSYPLVLLSNIGVPGTLCYLAFLARVTLDAWRAPGTDEERASALAAWHVLLVGMIGAAVSATVFDLGLTFYGFAAAACAGAVGQTRRAGLRTAAGAKADAPAGDGRSADGRSADARLARG